MPFIPDDEVARLIEKMSNRVDAIFNKHQQTITPEERELLRHLYRDICRDLDTTLDEAFCRRLLRPGSNMPDPDETEN